MKKKILLMLILGQLCVFQSVSQTKQFLNLSKIERKIESKISDIKEGIKRNVCYKSPAKEGGDDKDKRNIIWYSESFDEKKFQEVIDAKLIIAYDAGLLSRESFVEMKLLAGGKQKDFENDFQNFLVNNPLEEAPDPDAFLDDLLENSLDFTHGVLTPVLVKSWNCQIRKAKNRSPKDKCRYKNEGVSNKGQNKCNKRASSKLHETFPLCDGYYGVFLVTIKSHQKDYPGARCRGKHYRERCNSFFVLIKPTLPPGIEEYSPTPRNAFLCSDGMAELRMDKNVPFQDGICWSDLVDNKVKFPICSPNKYTKQVYTGSGLLYGAQYYRKYTNGCPGQIKGLVNPFIVVPIADLSIPEPLEFSLPICEPGIDTLKVTKFLTTEYSEIKREVLWYKTKDNQGETPFYIGPNYPEFFEKLTSVYYSYRDTYGESSCPPKESDRKKVTVIVLSNLIDYAEDVKLPEHLSFRIEDPRQYNPQPSCFSNSRYFVELDQIDKSQIETNILDNDETEEVVKAHEYSVRVRDAFIKWYRVEEDGTRTPYSLDDEIYEYRNGKYLVCAENAGIDQGDYNTVVTYEGDIMVDIEISDSQGRLTAPVSCPMYFTITRDIQLIKSDWESCASYYSKLPEMLANTVYQAGCNSIEYEMICPDNAHLVEIGIDQQSMDDLLVAVNDLAPNVQLFDSKSSWEQTIGLREPEKSITALNYHLVPAPEYSFEKYVLNIESNVSFFDKVHAQHCAFVFKCRNCDKTAVENIETNLNK
ncbi:hypothetical protein [Luteibaculum oceani]|uniref:Uncharacterized protein n=1 Tax=Luteibaculum oceani TaxID=1294296 RepID=A0A5C6VCU0_9FLAO|nr:hypothetical protein [Luteibaculum oceani]TXC81385.1 hypothetical protein FRX97_05105 [Luteibaculum oceani]